MRRVAAFFQGWRGLRRFWGLTLLVLAIGGGTLEVLGPPQSAGPSVRGHAEPPRTVTRKPDAAQEQMAIRVVPIPVVPRADRPGRDTPGPVNDPDPALLEPVAGSATEALPRVASDGRKPMRLYAAGFDVSTTRPRVGLLLAGIGLGFADSKKAIVDLPGEITLAVSPYAVNAGPLLSSARLAGHEYLLSVPMEPLGFPLNDPGPNALMTTLSPEQNLPRLHWALARLQGYVGATAVLGAMKGERLADMAEQMSPLLAELDRRGLIYVGPPAPRGPMPSAWSSTIDVVIDEPASAADIIGKLAELEALARDRGSALGLATAPRPITVERIAAWTTGLANRGLALTPVSALVLPPAADKEAPR